MANKAAKGSRFEREICERLSLWWSGGERTDIFWRTAGSGARATQRGKSFKTTVNQHGDICATDPIGQPLLDLVSIEVKRGYSGHSLADLLDRAAGLEQVYEGWFAKAESSRKLAGVPHWLMIVQRNRREPIVILPWSLWSLLWQKTLGESLPLQLQLTYMDHGGIRESYSAARLDHFLEIVTPDLIRELVKRKNHEL